MTQGTFYPHTTEELFTECENRDRIYEIVAFDAWIANSDRHEGNLLVRQVPARQATAARKTLLLNDHSHCLIGPMQTGYALGFKVNAPPRNTVLIPYVLRAITDSSRLRDAIAQVQGISDQTIELALARMPASFLPSPHEGRLIRDYLPERRDCLVDVFRIHRSTFPDLDGGPP